MIKLRFWQCKDDTKGEIEEKAKREITGKSCLDCAKWQGYGYNCKGVNCINFSNFEIKR